MADSTCVDCPPVQTMTEAPSQQANDASSASEPTSAPIAVPRIVITYCTQCKWLLRAAYFAQELLSTFGTAIGEIALKPATGSLSRP